MKEQRNISDVSNDLQVSDTSADTDINEVLEPKEKVSKHGSKWKEEPGELDLIPSLEKFPSLSALSLPESVASIANFYSLQLYNSIIFQCHD